MRKTRKEIVDYVVSTIRKEGRALDKSRCFYYIECTGQRCAVGMVLKDPAQSQYDFGNINLWGWFSGTELSWEEFQEKYFKKSFRGHPISLWIQLQNLHDSFAFWTGSREEDLTDLGEELVSILSDEGAKWAARLPESSSFMDQAGEVVLNTNLPILKAFQGDDTEGIFEDSLKCEVKMPQ